MTSFVLLAYLTATFAAAIGSFDRQMVGLEEIGDAFGVGILERELHQLVLVLFPAARLLTFAESAD
jgi:hypothetical protein